jgi:hypothetical protein
MVKVASLNLFTAQWAHGISRESCPLGALLVRYMHKDKNAEFPMLHFWDFSKHESFN